MENPQSKFVIPSLSRDLLLCLFLAALAKLEVPRQARDDNKGLAGETAGQIHRRGEKMEVIGARDFDGAELLQVGRDPLGVEENEAPLLEVLDQTEECDLRRV